uniref:Ribonuclease H1 n=1 Tax=Romanomermis culicivorax TaxID=13658 RepID=A0A915HHT0_ROMCU
MSPKFYAVKVGRQTGIFSTWDQCKAQTDGFAKAKFKKFDSLEQAERFIKGDDICCSSNNASTIISTGRVSKTNSSASRYKPYSRPNVRNARNSSAPKSNASDKLPSVIAQNRLDSEIFEDVVYTDGCCFGNGSGKPVAGIGVYWGRGNPNNLSEPVKGRKTNNCAEIEACCRALEQAKTLGISRLEIRTDSQFVINCMTKWLDGWKMNGWMTKANEEVKNIVELKRLDECRENILVKWTYVAGHVGIAGNEEADKLAKKGAVKSRK